MADTNDSHGGAFCTRRRRSLTEDLTALHDADLLALGVWRGAIADTVADLLERQGCSATGHLHSQAWFDGDMQ